MPQLPTPTTRGADAFALHGMCVVAVTRVPTRRPGRATLWCDQTNAMVKQCAMFGGSFRSATQAAMMALLLT